jgi:hypothetical protein
MSIVRNPLRKIYLLPTLSLIRINAQRLESFSVSEDKCYQVESDRFVKRTYLGMTRHLSPPPFSRVEWSARAGACAPSTPSLFQERSLDNGRWHSASTQEG